MHKIYELRERIRKELEEYGAKEKLDLPTLDIIDKLAHAGKNIDKILENCEMEGYSETGMSRRMYPDYSMNGSSYARGRGRYAGRDSMGRYSGGYGYSRAEDAMDSMIMELRELMRDLPPEKQHEAQEFVRRMEMM